LQMHTAVSNIVAEWKAKDGNCAPTINCSHSGNFPLLRKFSFKNTKFEVKNFSISENLEAKLIC